MFGWDHNVLTGEITKVEYTPEQIEQAEKEGAEMQIKLDAENAEAEAKAQAKATAEGKLAALGLTTDDLRALGL